MIRFCNLPPAQPQKLTLSGEYPFYTLSWTSGSGYSPTDSYLVVVQKENEENPFFRRIIYSTKIQVKR